MITPSKGPTSVIAAFCLLTLNFRRGATNNCRRQSDPLVPCLCCTRHPQPCCGRELASCWAQRHSSWGRTAAKHSWARTVALPSSGFSKTTSVHGSSHLGCTTLQEVINHGQSVMKSAQVGTLHIIPVVIAMMCSTTWKDEDRSRCEMFNPSDAGDLCQLPTWQKFPD